MGDLMDCNEFLEAVGIKVKRPYYRGLREFDDYPNPNKRVPREHYSENNVSLFLDGNQGDSKEKSTIESTTLDLRPALRKHLICSYCKRGDQFHLTSPACWPITVVAVTCYVCGHVVGYFDETVSKVLLDIDAKFEMPPRQSTISHRTFKPALFSEDQQRAFVVEGLKLNVDVDQLCEDLNVTPEYVHAVAVNAGYTRAQKSFPSKSKSPRRDQIVKLHEEGKTDRQTAEILNISVRNSKQIRRLAGLKPNRPYFMWDEIRRRWLAGERPCDIACSLGIKSPAVSKATEKLRKAGIFPNA
jgi:DNA-binding CsgD family transcriptional regulator